MIHEARKKEDPPSFILGTINHDKEKNVFMARHQFGPKFYKNETYFMQIHSRMRFENHWDTSLIKMLHNCEAGKKSVLTVSTPPYFYTNPGNGFFYAVS